MPAQPHSPNWYWNQLGADIVKDGYKRTVYINKKPVCIHVGHEVETKIAKSIYEEADGGN